MGLLSRLFLRQPLAGQDDPALDQALERTALRIHAKLKDTRHWPGRYRASIAAALAQARHVAQGIPGPVHLDREDWIKDPFVHALFANAEAMQRAISASPTLRDFVAARGGTEVHALLSLKRDTRRGFGMETSGEVLRRDVPQSVVWFSDPHFIGPAATEAEARENLLWALFDRFLERLEVGIERIRAERDRLTQDRDAAQARLRGAPPERRPGLVTALNGVLKQLGQSAECLDPEHLYEVFDIVLSHPEDCLYLEQQPLALDALGVVQNESDAATVLNFVDLMERYQSPLCVVLARCRDVTPSSVTQRLGEAGHWL